MNKNLGMAERCEVIKALLLAQEADFTIDYVDVWKNNHLIEGYVLKSPNHNCCPTIYYDEEWFAKTDEEVVLFLTRMFMEHACDYNVANMTNREYIIENVLPRMVSADNIAILEQEHIVYSRFLDMAIIYYVPVNDFKDGGFSSFNVTGKMLSVAGISYEEIYKAALENLEDTVEVKNMAQMMEEEFGMTFDSTHHLPMWIVTNRKRVHGAAAMLSKSVLQFLENTIGGAVAILPSSVHEVIAVPYELQEDLKMFAEMVSEINQSQVDIEEQLTNSVYRICNAKLSLAL